MLQDLNLDYGDATYNLSLLNRYGYAVGSPQEQQHLAELKKLAAAAETTEDLIYVLQMLSIEQDEHAVITFTKSIVDGKVILTPTVDYNAITNNIVGNLLIDSVPTSGSAHTVSSGGVYTSLNTVKNAVRVHPAYTAPGATLSSTQSTSGLEIGQSISIPLTAGFIQNDAGTLSQISITKNGTTISSSTSYTDSVVVMNATPKVYQATATYLQGVLKQNNLLENDSTGQILSGSVGSNSLSYRGYYKSFFGPVSATPSTSSAVRALGSQIETITTITLNTGTVNQIFSLWVPATHSLVSVIDLDALGADLTSQYTQSALSVNDAAATPVSGKLYTMTQSVPYSVNHRHQITIN